LIQKFQMQNKKESKRNSPELDGLSSAEDHGHLVHDLGFKQPSSAFQSRRPKLLLLVDLSLLCTSEKRLWKETQCSGFLDPKIVGDGLGTDPMNRSPEFELLLMLPAARGFLRFCWDFG
jgi:hypothetical protein